MNFRQRQTDLHNALNVVVEEAKYYIEKNCHRVDDWTEMYLPIKNGNNINNPNKLEEATYHSASAIAHRQKRRAKREAQGKPVDYMDTEEKGDFGPVTSVTEPIMDESDGDFSITINGLQWWWIDDEACITIASYIENALDRKRKIDALIG